MTFDAIAEPACGLPRNGAEAAGKPKQIEKKPVILILHQPHSSPGHIGQWFLRNGYPLDIRRPRFGDPLPPTLSEHTGAVIFGGPMSANDADDYIKLETDWIGIALKEQRPFLGVCLGAQMMSRLLGATVRTDPDARVEIGYHAIEATQDGEQLIGGRWPDRVYQWHREGFDVPAGGRLLARADGAFPNQAYAYGPAAIGIQFHPEITNAMLHRWTGHNMHRLGLPGAQDRHDQATDHIWHAPKVHDWMDRLLRGWAAGGWRAPSPVPAASADAGA
jgi:GMP synthase (glutamine-hydrolysing)